MISKSLFRFLVPNAPIHTRLDRDVVFAKSDLLAPFDAATRLLSTNAVRAFQPGLQTPSLVSSFDGAIERILFAFPDYGIQSPEYTAAYRSVIDELRVGTKFVVVHHDNQVSRAAIQSWFRAAEHPDENVALVPLPNNVKFLDWAEDAYLSLRDSADDTSYLMEPWQFSRYGDALTAEAVQEYTDIRAAQAPLMFQGGNALVGDSFWLLGWDYFADSLTLLRQTGSPLNVEPNDVTVEYLEGVFRQYVDATRRLITVGTRKAMPQRSLYGRRESEAYYLDIATGGVGTYQPIFHIDMFVTPIGPDPDSRFHLFVGCPDYGDRLLGTKSPYSLAHVYSEIARDLETQGFVVHRNPLVHRSTAVRQAILGDLLEDGLKVGANQYDKNEIQIAIDDLTFAGASLDTKVCVRNWHHVTWNNCLVENSAEQGRHVYLPTYGHAANTDLARVDDEMRTLWSDLERFEPRFEVHSLGDFNEFVRRSGAVHCIKKYIRRGS